MVSKIAELRPFVFLVVITCILLVSPVWTNSIYATTQNPTDTTMGDLERIYQQKNVTRSHQVDGDNQSIGLSNTTDVKYPTFGTPIDQLPQLSVDTDHSINNTHDEQVIKWYRIDINTPSTYLINLTINNIDYVKFQLFNSQWEKINRDKIETKDDQQHSYFIGRLSQPIIYHWKYQD